jgi:hypothetical protein
MWKDKEEMEMIQDRREGKWKKKKKMEERERK